MEEDLSKLNIDELKEKFAKAKTPTYKRILEVEIDKREFEEKEKETERIRPLTRDLLEAVQKSGACKLNNCIRIASETRGYKIRVDDARRELELLHEKGKVIKQKKKTGEGGEPEDWFYPIEIFREE